MNFDEYRSYDGLGLARLVAEKQVKETELAEIAIDRLEAINPDLNLIVERLYEKARMGEVANGPFSGVPFLMKDLGGMMKGVRQTLGCGLFRDFVAPYDSTNAQRLMDTGLNVIATTTTPECGMTFATESRLHGDTRNPWNRNRTPGGSSGGSAAGVAAGVTPLAHGSDGGGSIRVPAAACGLVGLKPSRGRISKGPVFGEAWNGMATEFAVTRSIRDTAALLDATQGADIGDPYAAPYHEGSFLAETVNDPGRLRLAFTLDNPFDSAVDPACAAAAQNAAELCESLGHTVEEAKPIFDGTLMRTSNQTVIAAHLATMLDDATKKRGNPLAENEVETMTWGMYQIGRSLKATDYTRAVTAIHGIGRAMGRFFENYDMLITPTTAQPPVPVGHLSAMTSNGREFSKRLWGFSPYTSQFNSTGLPAISLPLHWTSDGLPIGVQFASKLGADGIILRLAAQIEKAQPWFDKVPT